MTTDELYPGMPVMVHFSEERFSPEYSRVEAVHPDQNPWRSTVTVVSAAGSRRLFLAGAQVLDGDFGYKAYFNTLAQELRRVPFSTRTRPKRACGGSGWPGQAPSEAAGWPC